MNTNCCVCWAASLSAPAVQTSMAQQPIQQHCLGLCPQQPAALGLLPRSPSQPLDCRRRHCRSATLRSLLPNSQLPCLALFFCCTPLSPPVSSVLFCSPQFVHCRGPKPLCLQSMSKFRRGRTKLSNSGEVEEDLREERGPVRWSAAGLSSVRSPAVAILRD